MCIYMHVHELDTRTNKFNQNIDYLTVCMRVHEQCLG